MSTRLLLDGTDLRTLMLRVRDEMGPGATIVRAERVRTGGIAGFFAREHYELTVEVPDPPARPPAHSRPAPDAQPARPAGQLAEPIGLDALLAAADEAEATPQVSTSSDSFAEVLASIQKIAGPVSSAAPGAAANGAGAPVGARTPQVWVPSTPPPRVRRRSDAPISEHEALTELAALATPQTGRAAQGEPAAANGDGAAEAPGELAATPAPVTTAATPGPVTTAATPGPVVPRPAGPSTRAAVAPAVPSPSAAAPELEPVPVLEPELVPTPEPEPEPELGPAASAAANPAARAPAAPPAASAAAPHRPPRPARSSAARTLPEPDEPLVPAEPLDEDEHRPDAHVAALLELGVPTRLLARFDDREAVPLSTLVRTFDRAPALQLDAGSLVVVAGPPQLVVRTAVAMAHRAGLNGHDVVLAGDLDPLPGHGRRVQTTAAAARVRAKATAEPVPTVVALGVGAPAAGALLLSSFEPDQAWAAVDARLRGVELRRWLRAVGARRAFDAVAAQHLFDAQSPGTVLNLGVPVGWVDGLPGSPVVWAAVLAERLSDDARWD